MLLQNALMQAQQILLLRRFMQQLLGPSYKAVLPELLLRDADGADSSSFGDPGSSANVKMLQDLQALASSNGGLAAAGTKRAGLAFNAGDQPQTVICSCLHCPHSKANVNIVLWKGNPEPTCTG